MPERNRQYRRIRRRCALRHRLRQGSHRVPAPGTNSNATFAGAAARAGCARAAQATQGPASRTAAPPGEPMRDTPTQPQPPRGSIDQGVVAKASAAILDKPSLLPARCVVLDEFLAPQELDELTRFSLEHEADFSSQRGCFSGCGGRRRQLRAPPLSRPAGSEHHQDLMLERIKSVLPQVLAEARMEEFAITGVKPRSPPVMTAISSASTAITAVIPSPRAI